MSTTFQTQTTLLATAAAIVVASTLPFEDDLDATVEIVAQALGKLAADEVDSFDERKISPATATEIVYAALEVEAEDDDEATTVPSVSTTPPVAAINTTPTNLAASPLTTMLVMIKDIVLPIAEQMVMQEVEMGEINARLARLETMPNGSYN